jgi:hypothetical protein
MSELFDLESWRAWFSGLDREFIFLLVLPFVVALVGLWSAMVEKEAERDAGAAERPAPPERSVPDRRQRVRRREDVRRLSGSGG